MSSGFGILPEWLTLWFVFNTTFLVNSMCLAESLLPIAFVMILFSPFPVVITAKLVFDFGTKPVSRNYQDISNTPGKSLVDNLGFWYSGDISTQPWRKPAPNTRRRNQNDSTSMAGIIAPWKDIPAINLEMVKSG